MHRDESMARRDKTRNRDNKAHTHTHMIHTYLPQVYQKIEMKILGAEISLANSVLLCFLYLLWENRANSVLVRIKSRGLTVAKMR